MRKVAWLLRSADVWLIIKCEKFSHMTQRSVGVDNFMWVRVFLTALVAIGAWRLMSSDNMAVRVSAMFNMACMIYYYSSIRRIEDLVRAGGREKFCNPLKILPMIVSVRIAVAWMTALSMILTRLQGLGFLLDALVLYFTACDPLPPGTSKLRELVTSLFTSNKTVTQNN